MRTENDIRKMLESHTKAPPSEEIFKQLADDNEGTTVEYWRGHFDGVTFGYKACLGIA